MLLRRGQMAARQSREGKGQGRKVRSHWIGGLCRHSVSRHWRMDGFSCRGADGYALFQSDDQRDLRRVDCGDRGVAAILWRCGCFWRRIKPIFENRLIPVFCFIAFSRGSTKREISNYLLCRWDVYLVTNFAAALYKYVQIVYNEYMYDKTAEVHDEFS